MIMATKNNHSKTVLLILLLMAAVSVFGQKTTITGKVYDADGTSPLIGVTVQQKGQKSGAVTDLDGNFTITVNGANPVLTFNYLGYSPTTITVGKKTHISVTLSPEAKNLNEVVVTALGIKREEKSLGYSVTKLDNSELTKGISANWLDQMNGKVAGLSLQSAGTGPLGTTRVTLRGDHSLNYSNNSALFVVDGVPIQSGTVATGSGSTYSNTDAPVDFGNGAADINPDDIESVTVLKGAAATALYGSEGGNGAIVITTKGGKKAAKWGVTLNSSVVFDVASYWPDFQKEYGSGADMVLILFLIIVLRLLMLPMVLETMALTTRAHHSEKSMAKEKCAINIIHTIGKQVNIPLLLGNIKMIGTRVSSKQVPHGVIT